MVLCNYFKLLMFLGLLGGLDARRLQVRPARDGEIRPTLPTQEGPTRDGEIRPTLPILEGPARDGEIRPTLPTQEGPTRDGEIRPTLPILEGPARDGEIRPTLPTQEGPTRDGEIRPTLPTPTVADILEKSLNASAAIILNRENHETSEGLFEGDIVLTKEQQRLMQERKAIPDTNSYWPKDTSGTVTVGYRFGDSVINRTLVKTAISHWEEHTCIRFKELSTAIGDHLIFVDATNCASYVGRTTSYTPGQNIWLHTSCVTEIGPAIHEIGHAMGFYHEQSRSDRDDYVKVQFENIASDKTNNFDKHDTMNHGIPYDYWSVMHYGSDYFTMNGKSTLLAYNPLAQPLMGNRKGLSFADKRLANIMYGCLAKWVGQCGLTVDPCKNLGYIGKNCTCVCPEGTTGAQCQVLENSYTDALIKIKTPLSETITKEGIISTPGYPTPLQTGTRFVKVLVAPSCQRVRLTFNDFQVYGRASDGSCSIDALEIRLSDKIGTEKPFCGTEITSNQIFESENNTIVLNYYNYNYTSVTNYVSKFRGFKATVTFFLVVGCTTTPPTITTTPTTPPPSVTTPTITTTPATPPPSVTTPTITTTPTTTPPSVTIINSGVVNLTRAASSTGSCVFESYPYPPYYRLFSPRHPAIYRNGDKCNVVLETSEPRYLKVTASHVHITSVESLVLADVFDYSVRVTEAMAGGTVELLISASNITFVAKSTPARGDFELDIQVINSECHQIIQLKNGASGPLVVVNYAENTVCEWWIQAPPGKEIQLYFYSFDVGSSDCWSDYLGIDVRGDRYYKKNSHYYCGGDSPGSVTSSGGQLNVLLNGLAGGYTGFNATYSVVG